MRLQSSPVTKSSQAKRNCDLDSWTAAEVVDLVSNEQTPLEHISALLSCLYRRQSGEEQETGFTTDRNGAGFNKLDAEFLSGIARWSADHSGYLTQKQEHYARKRLKKYSRQLADALNSGELTLALDCPPG